MTEWVEQWTCITFCVKWKLFGWLRRPQPWATGGWQFHHNNMPVHESRLEFFGNTWNHPGTQPLYSPDLVPWDFWLFPKLKSPLKGKRLQTIDEIQEDTMGQLMATGRTGWGPKGPALKGPEAPLSFVQCFLCLVSSSVNVCFSYYMAGPFWTDLTYWPNNLVW